MIVFADVALVRGVLVECATLPVIEIVLSNASSLEVTHDCRAN